LANGDYLRILRRFWWVILLATALGAAGGWAISLTTAPQYASSAQLFVTANGGTAVGDAYQNSLFSQQRTVSYAGLATSEQVATRAIEELQAPLSADQLRSKITATPVPGTAFLAVTAVDQDPAAAQRYANAVADQLVQVASELETSRQGGPPAARAVVVDEAGYPTEAGGFSLLTVIAMGAAAGFVLGTIIAGLAGVLDTRMGRRERVEEVTGSLVLAALPDDRRRRADGVIDLATPGAAAERLRALRTNLQLATTADGRRPRIIAVTSPVHADGRSTTAVDLAAVFAENGRSVVLVDGDLINPSLAQRLPLSDDDRTRAAERGLATVLDGEHTIAEALIEQVGPHRSAFLPAGPVRSPRGQLWASDAAAGALEALRRDFDYVIIDTPPLTVCTDGALAAAHGDGAIVLARIGHTKTSALRQALGALLTANVSVIGAVVTDEPLPRSETRGPSKQSVPPPRAASTGVPAHSVPNFSAGPT
jgi:capsular exopolysaccharide synthesis family protein